MKIIIELIKQENLKEIYEFETRNRNYFEGVLPPRPKAYFNYNSFKTLMNEILLEQIRGECYMHIIRDESGVMVGRVNLHSISDEKIRKAELGYRISESEQGKGYASESVRQVLEKAFQIYNLGLVEAGTSAKNKGSQRVLIKNAFVKVGEEEKVMKINGEWVDGVLFEKGSDES